MLKKILKFLFIFLLAISTLYFLLTLGNRPKEISYGVSFSKYHSDELGLDWKKVLDALLNDLGVRKFRLSAHWPMVEAQKGVYNFSELDYQIAKTDQYGAEVVMVVGRRAPGWPECHEPDWANGLGWEDKKAEILKYIEATVTRYKNSKSIKYWQVENEPFLSVFAQEHCGKLDKDFFKKEIALVRKIDSSRKILVTDSGNLGLWQGAWRAGDFFGTSVYLYLWNPTIGQVKTIIPPSFYQFKKNLMRIVFGEKKSVLIELSLEPWLLEPMQNSPIETQISRMSPDKFDEVLDYARRTGFNEQYLWGAEWWYWMKTKGYNDYWERAEKIFKNNR